MNFAKIMDKDGASSLGSQVLAAKCAMMGLLKWMSSYDVGHILADTPNTSIFHDIKHVARQPRIDLRKQANYCSVSVEQVASYQQFIHKWMSPTDIESSEWLFDVLQLSIEPNLLLQLNQLHKSYPEVQRGGVLFFKLLLDTLDANTFENVKRHQDYIKEYKLSDTPDEDVVVSLSCFVAVHSMLDTRDVPSNIIQHMLNGQKHCAVEEYCNTVCGMLASIKGPLFDVYVRSMRAVTKSKFFISSLRSSRRNSRPSKLPRNGFPHPDRPVEPSSKPTLEKLVQFLMQMDSFSRTSHGKRGLTIKNARSAERRAILPNTVMIKAFEIDPGSHNHLPPYRILASPARMAFPKTALQGSSLTKPRILRNVSIKHLLTVLKMWRCWLTWQTL
jgi:hypothetical protein